MSSLPDSHAAPNPPVIVEKPSPSTDTNSISNAAEPNLPLVSPYLNTKHQMFCQIVGILPYQTSETTTHASLFAFPKSQASIPAGLYPRVVRAYRHHTLQYWFVATLSNALLWTQLILGATLAALGGSAIDNSREAAKNLATGVTVLSAIQTVIGGLIIYFKSRNQPNRTRQFRNALRDVRTAVENTEAMFRDVACPWDVTKRVSTLLEMYDTAIKTAEANYPDLWIGPQPPSKTANPALNTQPEGDKTTEPMKPNESA